MSTNLEYRQYIEMRAHLRKISIYHAPYQDDAEKSAARTLMWSSHGTSIVAAAARSDVGADGAPPRRKSREMALQILEVLSLEETVKESMWNGTSTKQALVGACALTAPANHACRESALSTLKQLAWLDANREPMWSDGPTRQALVVATQLLAPDDRRCREPALLALYLLSLNTSLKNPMWCDKPTRTALVTASQLGASADRTCRRYALSALAKFSCDGPTAKSMWRDEAAKLAIVRGCELVAQADRECKLIALHVLSNVSRDHTNRESMWSDTSTRQALVCACALTALDDCACRDIALWTLGILSEHPVVKGQMWGDAPTQAVLVTACQRIAPADRASRELALEILVNLATHSGAVLEDMLATYPRIATSAVAAAALLDPACADVRAHGQLLMSALKTSTAWRDDMGCGESSDDDTEPEAAAANQTPVMLQRQHAAHERGKFSLKPLPPLQSVSLKTSTERRAGLLADWLTTATVVVADNEQTSEAETIDVTSVFDTAVARVTAEHVARLATVADEHAVAVAKADAARSARTAGSEKELAAAKSAALTVHTRRLASSQRLLQLQRSELAEIEAAYTETRDPIPAAESGGASSPRKRKNCVGGTPLSAERGKRAAVAPSCRERPAAHACPLTLDTMTDPVLAADGHTYEREAIANWFERNSTSPLTSLDLPTTNLVPNILVKQWIRGWAP